MSAFLPKISAGARRSEISALRGTDLDPDKKTLRIERAIEEPDKHGLRIKAPNTERGEAHHHN
jgi:hypothetical protein